jgi:hypothetical protein
MTLTIAAVMAKPLSSPLMDATAGAGRFATIPVAPLAAGGGGRCAVGGAEATRVPADPGGGGKGALGAADAPGGGGGAAERGAAATELATWPPAGNVGSLMVGAAVGFGGKVIRTVSFFG